MADYWKNIAARTGGRHSEDDFEEAAYRLITDQVIYAADHGNVSLFWLIDSYRQEFEKVLAPFGVFLQGSRQQGYICATPEHSKTSGASRTLTTLALVLLAIYDDGAKSGSQTDEGEVICTLVQLEEKYRILINRDLLPRPELESALKQFKRWGIAKKAEVNSDGSPTALDQPFEIIVRPAITAVLGEGALSKLGRWSSQAKQGDSGPLEGEEEINDQP